MKEAIVSKLSLLKRLCFEGARGFSRDVDALGFKAFAGIGQPFAKVTSGSATHKCFAAHRQTHLGFPPQDKRFTNSF